MSSPLLWEYNKTRTSKERPARQGGFQYGPLELAWYNVIAHDEALSGRGSWRRRDVAKILLVEDNELNHDMLSRRLTRRGFQVVIAVDGAQGVALALAESPDLILMDMSLPVMDGWEAAQRLKAAPETQVIPIIALTAHAMAGDREKALAAGCDDYDTKPIEFNRLFGKIQTLLGQEPSQE
jgi:CheY-like chemotaxis protein